MQDQIDPLLRESPTIMAILADDVATAKAEALAEGEAKGLQEAILDLVGARFSSQVVAHVQQAIAPSQNVEQLKRFFRQLIRVSDEEEVYASLAQCFSTD